LGRGNDVDRAAVVRVHGAIELIGHVGSDRRLAASEPGLIVLPRSRVRVRIPTAAYVLNDHIAHVTGPGGAWYGNRAIWGQPYDALALALTGARSTLDKRARLSRWASVEPRPCSSYPTAARLEDLPPEVRARVAADYGVGVGADALIFVIVSLPFARAVAHVEACPGITVGSAQGAQGETTFYVGATSFEALSRLAQSEVVRAMQIRQQPRYHTN
jgi:hypothetical protein